MGKEKFKGSYYNFWIEDIFPSYSDKCYIVSVVPNINSTFFPPYHLRYIKVSPELLEKEYFEEIERDLKDSPFKNKRFDFTGSVKQGGYYEVDPCILKGKKLFCSLYKKENSENDNIINEDFIFDQENDIFKNSFKESPVDTSNIKGNGYADYRNLDYNDKDKLNCVYLYCFNVGQGDSFLLIPTSGNPYIIDINVYKYEHCKQYDKFVEKVKNILLYHRLKRDYIKGLIITHKHTDHCRGGGYFIDNSEIEIENFLINDDYVYNTKTVKNLLDSARNINTWVNVNLPGRIVEGNTIINILNPDIDTNNENQCKNINNSSICVSLEFKNNKVFLTGDAGITVLLDKYRNLYENKTNNFLKVSHHGSNTGTDERVLNLLIPRKAFISVGNNRKYKHPSNNVVDMIRAFGCDLEVSKYICKDLCYCFDGNQIYWNTLD